MILKAGKKSSTAEQKFDRICAAKLTFILFWNFKPNRCLLVIFGARTRLCILFIVNKSMSDHLALLWLLATSLQT